MPTPPTTPGSDDSVRTFRVTHPFHPLSGQIFQLVTVRHSWGEDRVYYHDAQGVLVSMPASWTDVVAPDPVVALSAGRSPFRLDDLLELTRLVAAWRQEVIHDC